MSLYDFVAKKGDQQEKDIEMITFKNYKHTSSKTLILHKYIYMPYIPIPIHIYICI